MFSFSFAALVLGLTLGSAVSAQTQAQSQPCTPAATQTGKSQQQSPQSVSQAGQNVKDSFKSLGSVFSKKTQPAAGSTAPPCPPAAAAAPAAAPGAQPAGTAAPADQGTQGAAAPWSPGDSAAPQSAPKAATATAFTGTLDPAKLPDVVGVHVGMPIDEALAILKKLHGGNVNVVSAGNPINYTRVNYQLNVNPPAGDSFQVDYTFPPGVQRVADVTHGSQYYPPVSHTNMLEGLRAKYGKETLAIAGPMPAKPGEDARITQMYWLFDENGKPIAPGPVTNMAPYGCTQDHYGVGYATMVNASMQNRLPAPTFCDSLIILTVAFSNEETVGLSQTTIIDNGLLLRSVKATGNYQAELAKKQHEQQLQQSNQAKPTL
jgi:hypothetical protein